jgi:uncharacterized protein YndB with AHSA1/START domain
MSRNAVRISASPDAVFDVLDDAYAYARWVVGARRVRRVDPEWPAVGSRFHHAIGNAAGELLDSSKILERDRPQRLVLEVRFRPMGVARVEIDVTPDGAETVVTIAESPTDGPASHVPRVIVDPMLAVRNAVSLQRLRHEVERRVEQGAASSDGRRWADGRGSPSSGGR